MCYAVNSPTDSPSYGKIVDDFIKYLDGLTEESSGNLKSAIPELRHFDGKAFVKPTALTKNLNKIKEDRTTSTIRQNISYLRRPRDDKIIIE